MRVCLCVGGRERGKRKTYELSSYWQVPRKKSVKTSLVSRFLVQRCDVLVPVEWSFLRSLRGEDLEGGINTETNMVVITSLSPTSSLLSKTLFSKHTNPVFSVIDFFFSMVSKKRWQVKEMGKNWEFRNSTFFLCKKQYGISQLSTGEYRQNYNTY